MIKNRSQTEENNKTLFLPGYAKIRCWFLPVIGEDA